MPRLAVSLIVPVYNASQHLAEAIASTLEIAEIAEVIIVDDASTDGSQEIAQNLAKQHRKIRLASHGAGINKGAGASRNLGIELARSDWIAFLDADDYLLPHRFRHTAVALAAEPDADGIYEAVGTVFDNKEAEDWWVSRRDGASLTTLHESLSPIDLFDGLLLGRKG